MNLKQIFKAISLISDSRLGLDINNKFYFSPGLEIGGDGILRSISGRGDTPEEAIFDCWNQITNIPSDRHLRSMKNGKRYEWNEFMWTELKVE